MSVQYPQRAMSGVRWRVRPGGGAGVCWPSRHLYLLLRRLRQIKVGTFKVPVSVCHGQSDGVKIFQWLEVGTGIKKDLKKWNVFVPVYIEQFVSTIF